MENNITEEKKKHNIIPIIIIFLLVIAISGGVYFVKFKDKDTSSEKIEVQNNNKYLAYRLSGNSLEAFDLYFLQLENEKKNKLYSPLSIKYALEMLAEGANGETKEQISNIIGTYSSKKYINSSNMSFANALFIKNSFKDSIKDSYINTLSNKYNANVVYDSFTTPNVLNSWVSDTSYWLGSAGSDDTMYGVSGDGTVSTVSYSNSSEYGIRPVIIISRENLKNLPVWAKGISYDSSSSQLECNNVQCAIDKINEILN